MGDCAWEQSKENILPLKRGRSVSVLTEALQGKSSELQAQMDQFEETVMKDESEDPLQDWLSYIKWTRDHFPTDGSRALELIERATAEFVQEKKYASDERYVRLWIEYADLVRNQMDLFKFMYTNSIGVGFALFWAAWAMVAEKNDNHKDADKLYTKGIKKNAHPKELLTRRYQQFQRRMSRRLLEGSESKATASEQEEKRAVFRPLSRAEARSGRRQAFADENAPSGSNQQRRTVRGLSSRPAAGGAGGLDASGQAAGFSVFTDTGPTDDIDAPPAASTWTSLPPEKVRTKENAAPVTKWSEGGLRPSSRSQAPTLPAAVTAAPALDVFVEEEFQNSAASAEPAQPAIDRPKLSLRQQIDSVRASELIYDNPLARHKSVLEGQTKSSHAEGGAPAASRAAAPQPSRDPILAPKPAVPAATPKDSSAKETPGAVMLVCDKWVIGSDAQNNECQFEEMRARKYNFSPVKFSPKRQANKTEGEEKRHKSSKSADLAEAFLDGLDQADNDDLTINTRLAMQHIDSMFASPDGKSAADQPAQPMKGKILATSSFIAGGSSPPTGAGHGKLKMGDVLKNVRDQEASFDDRGKTTICGVSFTIYGDDPRDDMSMSCRNDTVLGGDFHIFDESQVDIEPPKEQPNKRQAAQSSISRDPHRLSVGHTEEFFLGPAGELSMIPENTDEFSYQTSITGTFETPGGALTSSRSSSSKLSSSSSTRQRTQRKPDSRPPSASSSSGLSFQIFSES